MSDASRPHDPIAESLPYDSDVPEEVQDAWHAVVHLVVPCRDGNGAAVDNAAAAADYITETLRGRFLDWGYVATPEGDPQTPIPVLVPRPYVEGTFLEDESPGISSADPTDRPGTGAPANAVTELVALCDERGIEPSMLDDLVHDQKGDEAAVIDNGGLPSQLEYLVARLGPAATRKVIDRIDGAAV